MYTPSFWVVAFLCVAAGVYAYFDRYHLLLCFCAYCHYFKMRWKHLRNRRDLGRFCPRRPRPYEKRVREIIDTAAYRASQLPTPDSELEYVELLDGTKYAPLIWARVTITQDILEIVIEHLTNIDDEGACHVEDIEYLFRCEYVVPVEIQSAPSPHDFEFQDRE